MIRHLAWELLRSGTGAPTRYVGEVAAREGLDPRDRGLLARIVTTEVRRRGTLQALVRAFAKGKPSRDLTAFLRIGFAQLYFLDRVPSHAAVSETVGAASECLGLTKGKYVNGVLRTALRSSSEELTGDPRRDVLGREVSFDVPVFYDPEEHPYLWAEDALSLPAPLYKGWVKRFGEADAKALALAMLEDPRLSLRATHGTREALEAELTALEISTGRGEHADTLTAAPDGLEGALASAAFAEGRMTVQGEAALHAAEHCEASAGERWLDLCAAPGGKTAVLAERGARVVACDVSEDKLERLRSTLVRLGVAESVETRLLDEGESAPETDFDGVLLDVPCSNTAVLARRPEARWRFGPKAKQSLDALQAELLERGARSVRPGGKLVYSTCSLEPFENEQRVRRFVEAHPEFTLEADRFTLPRPTDDRGPVDGGYAARMIRGE